ncbi:protoporphyrinogen oxidase HemJ [Synechococcus sp. PCC 6312]|uniref:protoporphyrinogen oxidase HemJ n=1 Tax=Synechococcus sp. (strain ATCC 27167 / PCC 6312) TaxID=195253 RepID=UPI00029F2DC7|nr:protoporphyrinogen oxidase HemJ [Synechococcus sp. PCC 6312]AFY60153.1 TIGR00701 family protein [Synechococcus sp. PCC 6312]
MAYLWFKSFHILGFVAWFAGLFYLPRLFVYHIEAQEKPEPIKSALKEEYNRMEVRLYKLIMNPAMIFTIAMAIGMIGLQTSLLHDTWLHIKLLLVVLLLGFHHWCGRLIKQLNTDTCPFNSIQMRRINEIPTILLGLIVLLAIFKNTLPVNATVIGIGGTIILFAVIIQLYARKRRLDQQLAQQTEELGTSG